MAFVALEKLINLRDGYRQVARIGQRELLLLCEEGKTFLVDNRCPHLQHALQKGAVQGARLRCPAHGFEFDLHTGQSLQPGCAALGRYKLAYRGNEVGVEL